MIIMFTVTVIFIVIFMIIFIFIFIFTFIIYIYTYFLLFGISPLNLEIITSGTQVPHKGAGTSFAVFPPYRYQQAS